MSAIQKFNGAVNSLPEMLQLAELFAASGMFPDAKEKGQALVKIQAGAELGILPFQAMSGIFIVKYKVCIGSILMAAKVKRSGKYTFKVLTQTDTVCKIEFFEKIGGKFESQGISEMTIEQARKLGSQNLEKMPRNMLYARAISNGVRWFCPDVFMGVFYTPDELGVRVNENEQPIETTYEEVVRAEKENQKVIEQPLGDKIAVLFPFFERYIVSKEQVLQVAGKNLEELTEADYEMLKQMLVELRDNKNSPTNAKDCIKKYTDVFQFVVETETETTDEDGINE